MDVDGHTHFSKSYATHSNNTALHSNAAS